MLEKILQAFMSPFLFLASLIIPKRNNLWVCSAWFGKRYADSPRAIFKKCHESSDLTVSAYWLYKSSRPTDPDVPDANFVDCYSLRGLWLQLRARVFVMCVNSRDFVPGCVTPRNFVLQTWHGTPMKEIGYRMISGNRFDVLKFWMRRYTTDNYDVILSPNSYTDQVFAEAFQVPRSRLWRCPYPRNADLFIDQDRRRYIRECLFKDPDKIVWIYLPTHRNEGLDASDTSFGYEQLLSIDAVLAKNGVAVAFKPHFYEEEFFDNMAEGEAVYRLPSTERFSLYEALGAADGLITDYSSVAYDFQDISENIILFLHDLEQYRRTHRDLVRLPMQDFKNVTMEIRALEQMLISESERIGLSPPTINARDFNRELIEKILERVNA